ncbi:hypothetical protein C8R45DRAFT_236450 [Mycena sanguinolenta]|nr:hypothetical protein C8R45DRAFT_236450 [Mycena sanguinolenta]
MRRDETMHNMYIACSSSGSSRIAGSSWRINRTDGEAETTGRAGRGVGEGRGGGKGKGGKSGGGQEDARGRNRSAGETTKAPSASQSARLTAPHPHPPPPRTPLPLRLLPRLLLLRLRRPRGGRHRREEHAVALLELVLLLDAVLFEDDRGDQVVEEVLDACERKGKPGRRERKRGRRRK